MIGYERKRDEWNYYVIIIISDIYALINSQKILLSSFYLYFICISSLYVSWHSITKGFCPAIFLGNALSSSCDSLRLCYTFTICIWII